VLHGTPLHDTPDPSTMPPQQSTDGGSGASAPPAYTADGFEADEAARSHDHDLRPGSTNTRFKEISSELEDTMKPEAEKTDAVGLRLFDIVAAVVSAMGHSDHDERTDADVAADTADGKEQYEHINGDYRRYVRAQSDELEPHVTGEKTEEVLAWGRNKISGEWPAADFLPETRDKMIQAFDTVLDSSSGDSTNVLSPDAVSGFKAEVNRALQTAKSTYESKRDLPEDSTVEAIEDATRLANAAEHHMKSGNPRDRLAAFDEKDEKKEVLTSAITECAALTTKLNDNVAASEAAINKADEGKAATLLTFDGSAKAAKTRTGMHDEDEQELTRRRAEADDMFQAAELAHRHENECQRLEAAKMDAASLKALSTGRFDVATADKVTGLTRAKCRAVKAGAIAMDKRAGLESEHHDASEDADSVAAKRRRARGHTVVERKMAASLKTMFGVLYTDLKNQASTWRSEHYRLSTAVLRGREQLISMLVQDLLNDKVIPAARTCETATMKREIAQRELDNCPPDRAELERRVVAVEAANKEDEASTGALDAAKTEIDDCTATTGYHEIRAELKKRAPGDRLPDDPTACSKDWDSKCRCPACIEPAPTPPLPSGPGFGGFLSLMWGGGR